MESLEALHDLFQRNTAFLLRVHLSDAATVGAVIEACTTAGARVGDVELVQDETVEGVGYHVWIFTTGDDQMAAACMAVGAVEGAEVVAVLDAAMESHRRGSTRVESIAAIESNTDLRIVYTPGVARVCRAIEARPELAREFTGICDRVAICTNGTAILGLGHIGTLAGLPVMEGKSAIFAEFAGINAEPVLIDTLDPEKFVDVMVTIAGSYGAIQVEDVKAPECFAITRELDKRLNIPVLHDDQHGTATIVLAGLYSALNRTGKRINDMACAISGAGAAGTAIADLLLGAGVPDVVLCDSRGIVSRDRTDLNDEKRALAERTNTDNVTGTLADAMKGRALFIGVSQPNIVSQEMVRTMAKKPILFPLANPVSEICRADALIAGAAVYADGRMMNNALAYPGLFRGALDSGTTRFTIEMLMAAAKALADIVPEGKLMPEMMDPETHQAVADAVMESAGQDGTAVM